MPVTMSDNCRLCSTSQRLMSMFDEQRQRRCQMMRYFIWLATGIEIKETDTVSKMVCHRCCEIAIKLHKYRTNAVANDKLLKEQMGLPYKPPITDQNERLCPASSLINQQCDVPAANNSNSSSSHSRPEECDNAQTKVTYKHPSVQRILGAFENIVIPEEILNCDISPVISLDAGDLDNWYGKQLLTLKSKLKGVTIKFVRRVGNHSSTSSQSTVTLSEVPNNDIAKCTEVTNITNNTPLDSQSARMEVDCQSKTNNSPELNNRQTARKRTAPRPIQQRPSSEESNEYGARKRLKADNSVTALITQNHLNIEESSSKGTQDRVSPLFAEIPSAQPPELVETNAHSVFMCSICYKLSDTKKQLLDHERTHLKCKICRKTMKTLTLLLEHQSESCFVNILKNKPLIKLTRCDTVPSILNQYPTAFQKRDHAEQVESDSHSDILESVQKVAPELTIVEREDTAGGSPILTCQIISDDSGDECTKIPQQKTVNKPNIDTAVTSLSKPSESETRKSTTEDNLATSGKEEPSATRPVRHFLNEKEMIRSLLEKHSRLSEKCDKGMETLLPSQNIVKDTNPKLIVLENMFHDLANYKIPINLESQPKFNVRFKRNVTVPEPPNNLECWAFKKPIVIQNQNVVQILPKPCNILPNNAIQNRNVPQANSVPTSEPSKNTFLFSVLNSPSGTPSNTVAGFPNSLLVNTPTVLNKFPSNITLPVTTTALNTSNTYPMTLTSTTSPKFYNTTTPTLVSLNPITFGNLQHPNNNFVQFVDSSNALQYQGSSAIPQNNSSLVLKQNRTQQNVLHVNNNVNNIIVLTGGVSDSANNIMSRNNVPTTPTCIANVNYSAPYLNNLYARVVVPAEKPTKVHEVESVGPDMEKLPSSKANKQIGNGRLRVKTISELN